MLPRMESYHMKLMARSLQNNCMRKKEESILLYLISHQIIINYLWFWLIYFFLEEDWIWLVSAASLYKIRQDDDAYFFSWIKLIIHWPKTLVEGNLLWISKLLTSNLTKYLLMLCTSCLMHVSFWFLYNKIYSKYLFPWYTLY